MCVTLIKSTVKSHRHLQWVDTVNWLRLISCLIVIRLVGGEKKKLRACVCAYPCVRARVCSTSRCSQWARGAETVSGKHNPRAASARQRPTNERRSVRGRDTVRAAAAPRSLGLRRFLNEPWWRWCAEHVIYVVQQASSLSVNGLINYLDQQWICWNGFFYSSCSCVVMMI